MAFNYKDYLKKQKDQSAKNFQKSQMKTTATKQPSAPSYTTSQREYIKDLGYTPKTIPGSRSQNNDNSFIGKVFDAVGRFGSGTIGAVSKIYSDFNRNAKADGSGDFGSNLRVLPNAFEGFKEGFAGDTVYTGKGLVSQVFDSKNFRNYRSP